MHYYKRNLGDYAKKAGRLSMLQHGSYTLLLDACYDREEFPTMEQALEWTWASTPEEIDAVKFVLSRFFVLNAEGVYIQDRVLEELLDYQSKADKNKQIAIERETKRAEKRTNRAPIVNGSSPEQHEPPPNHKPLTNNQDKEPTVLVDDKSSTPAGPISIDRVDCPMQAIADAWNEVAVSMPAVKPVAEWADARKRAVKARWVDKLKLKKYTDRQTGIDYWTRLFARVESSDFLAGRGGGTFNATLDWVMNPTNLAKIIETGYPNRQAATA